MKPQQQQKAAVVARESIVGGNACTMCLYNIPRSSLMIAIPGLVIVVCGAAMTAFIEPGQSWTDGLAMVALVCLALGGVWTVGGLIFWFVAWWRFKPKSKPRKTRVSAGYDNAGVQLEAVISHACYTPSKRQASSSTNSDHTHDIKTKSEQSDADKSVPDDDVVYTVP